VDRHLKVLIAVAVAVPVFVELRTLGGIFGFEVSLPVSVVAAVVAAIAVVLIDEAYPLGSGSELVKDKD
jgi:uncharacterized membrane protein YdjX (TVP38/TMEM64 family)